MKYRSEKDFKKSVLRALRNKNGWEVYCIETGGTAVGVPDIYILTNTTDIWIEFKNEKEQKGDREQWKIGWRPGQQEFAEQYYIRHGRRKYTFTLVALSDSILLIPMTKWYNEGIVRRGDKEVKIIKGGVEEVARELIREINCYKNDTI